MFIPHEPDTKWQTGSYKQKSSKILNRVLPDLPASPLPQHCLRCLSQEVRQQLAQTGRGQQLAQEVRQQLAPRKQCWCQAQEQCWCQVQRRCPSSPSRTLHCCCCWCSPCQVIGRGLQWRQEQPPLGRLALNAVALWAIHRMSPGPRCAFWCLPEVQQRARLRMPRQNPQWLKLALQQRLQQLLGHSRVQYCWHCWIKLQS
mmetsp:Transcript_14168/g.26462  ORF Transcript_14168/g.26462 Transcript_14168/m.26462 type:complete len:201 (-) Transcript_14168:1187-1789(-)